MSFRFATAIIFLIHTAFGYGACRTETVGDLEWTYSIENGEAVVGGMGMNPAIPTWTTGDVVIPSVLGECPVTGVGKWAFYQCSGIRSLTVPKGVRWIGYLAFGGCTSLKRVDLPDSLATLESAVWSKCESIGAIRIPDTVTSFGRDMFRECTSLTNAVVPMHLQDLGVMTFYSCTSLETVKLPTNLTVLATSLFSNCSSLKHVEIPSGVTEMGQGVFNLCGSLTEITLPDKLTTIGVSSFSRCTSLRKIVIPASVTSLGGGLFSQCTGVTEVEIAADNPIYESIDGIPFERASKRMIWWPRGRTDYYIPSGTRIVGAEAFANLTSLKSFTIPEGVEQLDGGAFFGCRGMQSISLPSTLKTIGRTAFRWCEKMTSFELPASVVQVDDLAFSTCYDLCSISFAAPLVHLGNAVFDGDSRLTSVTFAGEVIANGANTFSGCPYPSGALIVGDQLVVAPERADYTIPAGVRRIGAGALAQTHIETLSVHADVTNVANGAFSCVTLTNVVLSMANAERVSKGFRGSDGIEAVTLVDGERELVIPRSWMLGYERYEKEFGSDFVESLFCSLKTHEDGSPAYVWEDYVQGTDPTDPESVFRATVTVGSDGIPVVGVDPELTPEQAELRSYTTYGKTSLSADEVWKEVKPGEEANYRFFKVGVKMKP